MFTEPYLEPTGTSMMEPFFTLAEPYFENVLNLIEFPLGSEKSILLTIEQFFIELQNCSMEWHHHKKKRKNE